MIISKIIASIGASIGGQVISYLKTRNQRIQFEAMQSEILEGWVYKIIIAVRDEHRRQDVPHKTHEKVVRAINRVVEREFDSKKL